VNPPIGAPSVAISPPISTPQLTRQPTVDVVPPPNRVRVVSYSVMRVEARPKDTITTLSKEHYGSDEYAEALFQYNLATPASRMDRSGVLKPGDIVLVPDVKKLETTYGDRIPTVLAERTGQQPVNAQPVPPQPLAPLQP